jgi:hypothetical protein
MHRRDTPLSLFFPPIISPQKFAFSPGTGLTHCFRCFFYIFTSELCVFTMHRFDTPVSMFFYIFTSELCVFTMHRFDTPVSMFFLYLHLRTLHSRHDAVDVLGTGTGFSVHDMKAYRGSSVVAPLVLNLGSRLRRLLI